MSALAKPAPPVDAAAAAKEKETEESQPEEEEQKQDITGKIAETGLEEKVEAQEAEGEVAKDMEQPPAKRSKTGP